MYRWGFFVSSLGEGPPTARRNSLRSVTNVPFGGPSPAPTTRRVACRFLGRSSLCEMPPTARHISFGDTQVALWGHLARSDNPPGCLSVFGKVVAWRNAPNGTAYLLRRYASCLMGHLARADNPPGCLSVFGKVVAWRNAPNGTAYLLRRYASCLMGAPRPLRQPR
jgi:hypothetical protein